MTTTQRMIHRWLTMAIIACLLVAAMPTTTTVQAANYNYGEALQKSLFFYEAQRSGDLPANNRVVWRGDSGMTDGADVGKDLKGGWYDAGDHVKFGLPMASTATLLAWGLVDYRPAYTSSGQLNIALDQLKWATDYFVKAHTAPNELYIQVGAGGPDHAWWGPAEVMQMARPSYKITTTCPGSDVAGETAAALAAASIAFRPTDATYANTLLQHAEELYNFADLHRGKYSDCPALATVVNPFYTSYSGYNDELVWGAIWLYRAKEAKLAGSGASFMTKATTNYANLSNQTGQSVKSYKWTQAWDDKSYGSYILMAKLTGAQQYKDDAQRFLNWWTVGGTALGADGTKVAYSTGGQAHLDVWGSLRYAANTAFMALVYADYIGTGHASYAAYHNFAKNQIDYALGSNPRGCSYMIGFGACPPINPHHRGAHSSWMDSWQDAADPVNSRHNLIGALVGGPKLADDNYADLRSDYYMNEVATDYNAGLTGALVRLYQEYGGAPLSSFPPADFAPLDDEMYAKAALNASGGTFTEIRALLVNKSGWPARMGDKLSYKYFFTLDGATTPAQISFTTNYNQCGAGSVTGPTLWSGSTYYIQVNCTGTKIYPGGQSAYFAETQFRITSAGTWDTSNDWSYAGVATPNGATPVKVVKIPVYDNGVKVFGNEPGTGGGSTFTPTRTPTPGAPTFTPTRTNTPSGPTFTPTRTATRTNTPSGPTFTPTRTATRTNTPSGPTLTPTRTPTPGGTGTCSPITATITAPFSKDGAGIFCWQASNLGVFINSWGMTSLTINGVNYTNQWSSTSTLPAKIGGFWYISYTGVSNSHFEAPQP